ncbi:MAG: family 43 glycosylhydrolase [Clostridia bacterium]|nr:family 43 glycosylhydrolase [Clostridia bacterium]
MIETNIKKLRDPFILVEDGVYYAYGTGVGADNDWKNTIYACYKNTSGRLDGEWVRIENEIYVKPAHADRNLWAPEVHKYKGEFYMFTTYHSTHTDRRGSTVLKSKSPEGPFVEITRGTITPPEWDAIDSTLYIDPEGKPWMVFVHEWTRTDDNIGRMSIARMSDDLTRLISEPVDIFRADDPAWSGGRNVTDGCFMYTTKKGSLLMIWSNFCESGYGVGIARSENGNVNGKWIQEEKMLYSKALSGKYDGGHGMIFKALDGKMYLSVHTPNVPEDDRSEVPTFIEVIEENDTLVCKF